MKCTDLEALLCDYVDGVLSSAEKATVELHLEVCASCRELVEDSRAAVAFMGRAEDVKPPAALVNQILFDARQLTGKKSGTRSWIARLFEPVLQPKFAMGMAMTILSFSMLGRFAGIPARQLRASDLAPAKVWSTLEDKAWLTWERTKKYYESLRVVYEIQQTLNDWSQPAEEAQPQAVEGAQTPSKAGTAGEALEGPIPTRPQGESRNQGVDGRARK